MATQPVDDFDFEDDFDDAPSSRQKQAPEAPEADDGPSIEVVDDTPEEDRGREPMPKEIVDELEADELEDYSDKVKLRLKQMKKVWHDERRAKEREAREKAEALSVAQRLLEENRRLKSLVSSGELSLLDSYKQATNYELEMAKRAYREAYEAGDADRIIEAQQKLTEATFKANQLNAYRPTLQGADFAVDTPQAVPVAAQTPQPDERTLAWHKRNPWYGTDPEMTAAAAGLHQKLVSLHGAQYAGTDEYWENIDRTMRRRFPEYFGVDTPTADKPTTRGTKPSTVVAPASRSRSPKKIVLTRSQLETAKRLGVSPEQYAAELLKLEV